MTMPSATQLREERINQLCHIFRNKNIDTIDEIYRSALTLFPMVTKRKAKDYAEAALRILQSE